MSPHRTRGLFRAAALLVVGASPLAAGAATATPVDHAVDGKVGKAPEVNLEAAKGATDLLDGKAVRLPAPDRAPVTVPGATVPEFAVPQVPQVPALPKTSGARDLSSPTPPVAQTPAVPGLSGVEAPLDIPELGALPQLPTPGVLPLG